MIGTDKTTKGVIALAVISVAIFAVVASHEILTWQFVNPRGTQVETHVELHAWVQQFRNGELISQTYHAMSLTNQGKDWIEMKISNSGGANGTKFATYIGVSNDTTVFDAAWGVIPVEIADSGLTRANATYTSTGVGTWNLTVTFNVSQSSGTNLYGLYLSASAADLIAAEQQGSGNRKVMVNGDTLTVTVQGTIT